MSTPSLTSATRRARQPQIAWRSKGTGTATPLVLVNGFGASAIAWPRAWVRQLAAHTRVITVDNRGGGWSRSADVPFTIADMAGDIVDVLDDTEIDRAVVLGLSMGGMIAQQVAIDAPDRVAGLVLVATRPPSPRFRQPGLSTAFAFMRPVMPGESLHHYFRRLWSSAAAPGFPEAHPEAIEEFVEQTIELPHPTSDARPPDARDERVGPRRADHPDRRADDRGPRRARPLRADRERRGDRRADPRGAARAPDRRRTPGAI